MRRAFVALLGCGLIWAAGSVALGDPLEDLLDGRPLPEGQVESLEPARPVTSYQQEVTVPIGDVPLAQQAAWETPIVQEQLAKRAGSPVSRAAAPASVSMVPEPSAIALAVLAMLYFVIFFRRRHYA
jgi:hypothetical protein